MIRQTTRLRRPRPLFGSPDAARRDPHQPRVDL